MTTSARKAPVAQHWRHFLMIGFACGACVPAGRRITAALWPGPAGDWAVLVSAAGTCVAAAAAVLMARLLRALLTSKPEGAQENQGGINLVAVRCPRCALPLPAFRVPEGLYQVLWGGWTCPRCGCRMDKGGKALEAVGATGNGNVPR